MTDTPSKPPSDAAPPPRPGRHPALSEPLAAPDDAALTQTAALGRRPREHDGAANPPVHHASTILAPTLAEFRAMARQRQGDAVTYGVHGVPVTFALEEAIAALEGGHRTRLAPSGLLALTAALLSLTDAGDHILVVDSVYEPTRRFCEIDLKRFGVETTFYDPLIGGDVRALFRDNTRLVLLESPGSLTFEVQDAPAIVAAAQDIDAWTVFDNTWASPLYHKPLAYGVDVSIQAVTKYLAGHADLVMGAVTATERAYERLQPSWRRLGVSVGPDDVSLALRGVRTLPLRMAQHHKAGVAVAEWLARRPEVLSVRHPALPGDPGHALWRRDFTGAGSLFGFTLAPEFAEERRLAALLDGLRYFGLGFSWGGFISLMTPNNPRRLRTAAPWPRPGEPDGQSLRVFVGLEDPEDLIRDLEAGFERLRRG